MFLLSARWTKILFSARLFSIGRRGPLVETSQGNFYRVEYVPNRKNTHQITITKE